MNWSVCTTVRVNVQFIYWAKILYVHEWDFKPTMDGIAISVPDIVCVAGIHVFRTGKESKGIVSFRESFQTFDRCSEEAI